MENHHLLAIALGVIVLLYVIYLNVKLSNLKTKNSVFLMKLNSERQNLLNCQNELKQITSCEVVGEPEPAMKIVKDKDEFQEAKKVSQFNDKDEKIANFTSLRDASKKTKISRYRIKKSCEKGIKVNKTYFKYD